MNLGEILINEKKFTDSEIFYLELLSLCQNLNSDNHVKTG